MVSVCFYFQIHQPYRLRDYHVFDIGNDHNYFDDLKNISILRKVANKCYIPTTKLVLELLKKHPEFKVSYSFSGVVLSQFQEHAPELIRLFQSLADTGQVEILSETYYHSLSFLYSKKEFRDQVKLHKKKIKELFNQNSKVFRNTELIYNNELAKFVEDMGYKGIISEGADHILGWRSPNFLYRPKTTSRIKLLLKNYKLSDDIAFRFSNKSWESWPLTAEKFTDWVSNINGNGNCVNLFMDYETFGEHQWKDTGIFNFMKHLPEKILKNKDNNFMTPSGLIRSYEPVGELDIHNLISWADVERDLSAWLGNKMQQSAISNIYRMEDEVKGRKDLKVLEDWRRLQTSDNFYYMCTKWFNDGDVHKYFNPYDSPYDSYIAFMNVVNDLKMRLKKDETIKKEVENVQLLQEKAGNI